jgi:hypothetical protein
MLGAGPTSGHPYGSIAAPAPRASGMTGVKGISSQARRHVIGEGEHVVSSSQWSEMRAAQATPFLDVPFCHSERADSTARISPCLVAKGAEPSGIGATGGCVIDLGYSLTQIAVNILVDDFCRFC